MGRELARLISAAPDLELAAGIDRNEADDQATDVPGCDRIVMLADAADVLARVDVVLDFSAPAATRELLRLGGPALAGRGIIIGTTGLGPDVDALMTETGRTSALLVAANFSVGVNLLLALAERVAVVLEAGQFDVEIVEAHHNRKADAPSGTALALGHAVARGRGRELEEVRRDGRSGQVGARAPGEVGMHAIRGGGIVGDHGVLFLGEREQVELRHRALDRAVFADGAILAARWLAGRAPGRYGMADVLGLDEPALSGGRRG
jgi:4-hydroxy-tetrahydrodipicolinate reductase